MTTPNQPQQGQPPQPQGQQPPRTPPVAPPQTPGAMLAVRAQQQTQVQRVEAAQGLAVLNIAGRRDVERIEAEVALPADFQYAIKQRGQRLPDGQWGPDRFKVGITADGYDYLNRVVGCSFFLPEWVHDQAGVQQRNPIHRKDYIYLRLAAVWYTPLGQLVMATEDVEVDFNLTWMDARINAYGAEVLVDAATGMPLFDNFGNPAVKIDKAAELKALKTLSQLRTFGPRYAQTVARVRLLKMATGIRSLPINEPATFRVKVVGYRDKMTPQERIGQAGGDLGTLYGQADNLKPLTHEEMVAVNPDVDPDTEAIDREAVEAQQYEAAQQQQAQQAPRTVSGTPLNAPWSAEELADLDEHGR